MLKKFFGQLYVRIWLAVVASVLVLTLIFIGIWRSHMDRLRAERMAERLLEQAPVRELVVRNSAGDIISQASSRPGRQTGQPMDFQVTTPDGQTLSMQLLPRNRSAARGTERAMERSAGRSGLTFAPNWPGSPTGLLWLVGMVGLAVALGSYPIVRRLTKRLEGLQTSVDRLGRGDLGTRVDASGHDEVAFLATRFNAAADRIENLVQAHKSLLANASHELRSPLARIRMGMELLEYAASPPQRSALKSELTRSINELDALVDEILLASRLDAAQHDPKVPIGNLEMVDLIALAAEECARLGVPMHSEVQSLQIHGVAKLLRRMVRNLLENGKRHAGKEVSLSLRAQEIEVCDRGPGVAPCELERIFEPFYRASHASESDGGVGLGLALVQSIALRHGAKAQCHAREGGGTCFTVSWPQTVTNSQA